MLVELRSFESFSLLLDSIAPNRAVSKGAIDFVFVEVRQLCIHQDHTKYGPGVGQQLTSKPHG